jgi:DNA repair protein RadC
MDVPLEKEDRIRINGPESIYYVLRRVLMRGDQVERDQEHFWVLGLAHTNLILFLELVSLGNMNMVHVNPMEVFRVPLIKGAAKIVLVHNHPGIEHLPHDLDPSPGDNNVTDRMNQVGKIIQLPVLDHLIISPTLYYSYQKSGMLAELEKSTKWVPQYKEQERIRKEAIQIGMEKGIKKGKREGLKEGKKEGLKEGAEKEKINIAKKMKKNKVPIPIISVSTGLTAEEIEKL